MILKALSCCASLLLLASRICAQQPTSPQPTDSSPALTVTESEAPKALKPSSGTPSSPAGFPDRLNKLLKGSPPGDLVPEKTFKNNFLIKVDYRMKGVPSSFSIVTAHPRFSYQGLGKETILTNAVPAPIAAPSTILFDGRLSNETEDSIFLGYVIGQSVPFGTPIYSSGKAASSFASIQQIQTKMENGAVFQFGKALKTVESDGEEITITIHRMKNE